MPMVPVPRLYLFARLPDGLGDHVAASNDVAPMLPGLRLASGARLHSTIAVLDRPGVDQAYIVAMIGWIMATSPPFAFRLLFDEIVTSARQTLLKAREPLPGARDCQAHILGTVRHYGLDLPRTACPAPHVTLGYGRRTPRGVRPINGISWLVDELVLVRSWHGRSRHEELGRWHLPERRVAA